VRKTPAGSEPGEPGSASGPAGAADSAGTAVPAGPAGSASTARRGELTERLHRVRERIATACAPAGRDPAEITLVAITKTRPAADVRLLYELGQRDFGENRDQEAAPKAAQCADLPVTWHFVGQLQTNKAASVARYADVIHSVDRLRLIRALGNAARRQERTLTCLVQVSLEGPTADASRGGAPPAQFPALADVSRGGAPPPQVPALADAIAGEAGLILGGVMAIAPLGVPAAEAFARLAPAAAAVRAVWPAAAIISAGMSGDLEEAVAAGATHLRIGTALLGDRRPPVM
jgi:PLP dependent protein